MPGSKNFARDFTVTAAVITAVATLGAGAIQVFGPALLNKVEAEAPSRATRDNEAPDVSTPNPRATTESPAQFTADQGPSGPSADPGSGVEDADAAPEAQAPTIPHVATPALSGPPNAPTFSTTVSRAPTFEAGEAVLSAGKKVGSGYLRSTLVMTFEIENVSSDPIRFLVMTDETSLTLDGRTEFKVREVSTRYCTTSSQQCRRSFYDRYTQLASGEGRTVEITFYGDISPANLSVLPDAAKANLVVGLSVIYNEGPDEVVRLGDPSLNVDASTMN